MTGCTEASEWGPCIRHVTISVYDADRLIPVWKEETSHVAERITLKPDGEPHTTYANSKWVKQWPVSQPTS